MAIRNIRLDSDPILRKKSKTVTAFDEKLAELAQDMIETMNAAEGVGIAAPQVGILKRMVIVVRVDLEDAPPLVLVNPEIHHPEGKQCKAEACLSVKGRSGMVERPLSLVVKYQDLEGRQHELAATGDLTRVICHEVDHLNGQLFTDIMIEEIFEESDRDVRRPRKTTALDAIKSRRSGGDCCGEEGCSCHHA